MRASHSLTVRSGAAALAAPTDGRACAQPRAAPYPRAKARSRRPATTWERAEAAIRSVSAGRGVVSGVAQEALRRLQRRGAAELAVRRQHFLQAGVADHRAPAGADQ